MLSDTGHEALPSGVHWPCLAAALSACSNMGSPVVLD